MNKFGVWIFSSRDTTKVKVEKMRSRDRYAKNKFFLLMPGMPIIFRMLILDVRVERVPNPPLDLAMLICTVLIGSWL